MSNKLFDIVNGQVVMNPAILWIPHFKKIWDRDKSEGHELAQKEITYIVFKNKFKSPYDAYSEADKPKMIIKDFFQNYPDWEPDELIKEAEDKYNELQDSAVLRLFKSTKISLELITTFTKSVNDKINNGEIDISEADKILDRIVKNAKEVGNLVKSLNTLDEQVRKEQLEASSVRGATEIGLYEL